MAKKPCLEEDVKTYLDPEKEKAVWDEKTGQLALTPEILKAFYKEAKAWSDSGLTYPEILAKMQKTRGLKESTLAKILAADKTASRMTDEVWYRQAKYREIKSAAEQMVVNANIPWPVRGIAGAWNLSRSIATMYHGGVIPFSHAKNLIFNVLRPAEQKLWLRAVADAYRYGPVPFRGRGKGEAAWAKDMEHMVGSDKWIDAARHGVEVHPADKPVGILANIAKGWGVRSFDALKKLRVDLFALRKAQLKLTDDQSLRALANEVNISTGTLKMSEQAGRVAAAVSFAPKVWVTRRLEAFTPIRYGMKLGRMTQGERAVFNQSMKAWATHVAVAGAILEGNDLFNQYFTKGKQRVNFNDWTHPGTLWRMNIAGHIVPLSPLVEVARAPVAAVAAYFLTRRELQGRTSTDQAIEVGAREFFNAMHPSIITGLELASGREIFGVPRHERRLPFPGVKQLIRGEEPERDAPLSYTEYALERSAIPVADFAKEYFSSALTDEGIPKSTADKWIEGLASSVLSGFTATHEFQKEDTGRAKTRQKKPIGTMGGGHAPGTLHY